MKIKVYIGYFFVFLVLTACKKSAPTPNRAVDVYIAGSIQAANGNLVAAYWKNGVVTKLSDSSSNCGAISISVNGDDIYVGGNDAIKGGIYWKNGIPTALGASVGIKSLAASGNDLYIAGDFAQGDGYLKNGVFTNLKGSLLNTLGNSVAINGNDFYIAGDGDFGPNYWKNGASIPLADGKQKTDERATCIAISGNDIYVGGTTAFIGNTAYWKNGVPMVLSGVSEGGASAIALNGKNVYVCGNSGTPSGNFVATYWKNGVINQLGDLSFPSSANDIVVFGSDVYVVGGSNNKISFSTASALYWKNGVEKTLARIGSANAIVVLPR